jgi:hypothetical protein
VSSLRNVGVNPFTLFWTPGSMKCDSLASVLAHTFASLCLGREPKVKVLTYKLTIDFLDFHEKNVVV